MSRPWTSKAKLLSRGVRWGDYIRLWGVGLDCFTYTSVKRHFYFSNTLKTYYAMTANTAAVVFTSGNRTLQ